MESRLLNIHIPLIVSGILILVFTLFNGASFEWRLLIIPATIILVTQTTKSNYHSFIMMTTAVIIGITVYVVFPTMLSFFVLTLMAFKFNEHYQPTSVRPRLLKDRNISPFLFMSFAFTKIILYLLNVQFAFATDLEKNSSLLIFILTMASIGFLDSLLILSKENYNQLKTEVATKEKNWTNNVMALLSHNIRTPIASMGNRVDIIKLKKSAGIAISEEDIESLVDDRERINSIVHGLLSKSSRNIISSKNVSELSINQAINEYADRVEILKPEGIDFNLGSNDKIALDLALESVISNSEKYGASQIQITLRDNENEVSISVIDNGEGMNSETLERYGTPFNSSQSKKGGSGLGVYFALQLVKDAGWQWSVESSLGNGTTVTFSIPKQLLVF